MRPLATLVLPYHVSGYSVTTAGSVQWGLNSLLQQAEVNPDCTTSVSADASAFTEALQGAVSGDIVCIDEGIIRMDQQPHVPAGVSVAGSATGQTIVRASRRTEWHFGEAGLRFNNLGFQNISLSFRANRAISPLSISGCVMDGLKVDTFSAVMIRGNVVARDGIQVLATRAAVRDIKIVDNIVGFGADAKVPSRADPVRIEATTTTRPVRSTSTRAATTAGQGVDSASTTRSTTLVPMTTASVRTTTAGGSTPTSTTVLATTTFSSSTKQSRTTTATVVVSVNSAAATEIELHNQVSPSSGKLSGASSASSGEVEIPIPVLAHQGIGVFAAKGIRMTNVVVAGNTMSGKDAAIYVGGTVFNGVVTANHACKVEAGGGIVMGYNPPSADCTQVGTNTCAGSIFDGTCDEAIGLCASGTDCFDCGYPCLTETLPELEEQPCSAGLGGTNAADGSDYHCRPFTCEDGVKVFGLQRRVRKEIHDLSDAGFASFRDALKSLKDSKADYPGSYDSFVRMHQISKQAHGGPEFLPWHRRFLLEFETALQKASGSCALTLPYWNWAEETGNFAGSAVWSASRYGRLEEGCITSGVAAGWQNEEGNCVRRSPRAQLNGVLPSWVVVAEEIERTSDYEGAAGIRSKLEYALGHGAAHMMIGGDMGSLVSPRDPVFFLHHCFIDRLYSFWQDYHIVHSTGVAVNSCGGLRTCNALGGLGGMAQDWIGTLDVQEHCVPLPVSRPGSCLAYQGRAEAGWQSHVCAAVVGGIELGECAIESLAIGKAIDSENCHAHIDLSEELNVEWLKNMDSMHEEVGVGVVRPWTKKVEEAKVAFTDIREFTNSETLEPPSSEAEKVLCFRCSDRWFRAQCADSPLP
mmetsp:Transcript_35617/g.75417  ORF Transcript_35617/g.75417 Transcript_35617/m.75417 type:complete len:866 (+) Transcript_35617:47-2644(+)